MGPVPEVARCCASLHHWLPTRARSTGEEVVIGNGVPTFNPGITVILGHFAICRMKNLNRIVHLTSFQRD